MEAQNKVEDYSQIQQPDLKYQYQFEMDQLGQMSTCLETHGFAIVKNVLPKQIIDSLKRSVIDAADPNRTLKQGESRTLRAWVEADPNAWQLLEYEPFMKINQHLIRSDEMTIHRSAAIVRMPKSSPVAWHTDWRGFSLRKKPPKAANDVLNRGLWPSGNWFYITGSYPIHGGLCVIEDSHLENWSGPEGFTLKANKRSFYPEGQEPHAYEGFDVPGIVPLFTNPGDMIIFAHRTYHVAFPNQTDQIRLSCAIGFRDRNHQIDVPWEMPEEGQRFLDELPSHLQRYTHGYTSIV